MTDEFAAVVSRVRDRVTPSAEERDRLERVVADLVADTERAIADLPVEADVVHVGSTARDTWLAGDRDIDLFVSFPPALDRDRLRESGLQVGHAVLPESHEEYAEHPYVVGEYDGFEVDLVPCYGVADATAIRSAVDRTPFHSQYLEGRLDDDLAAAIRVCKQFLGGIGVYGSDLHTRGFSGFLTELLVVEYGGFRPFVEAAADWRPPVTFDPEGHGRESFEDPLVVVDPTDPERNVAAVCSETNVSRLQHYTRDLLANPREALFDPDDPDPAGPEAVREAIADRGTVPVALRFDAPGVVDDQLWPQLEKSRGSLAEELDRRGFDVFRSAAFAETGGEDTGDAVLLFELAVADRPLVERHEGPPLHVRDHAADFFETYADADVYGPFLDGDRYVVEREREYTSAVDLLRSDAVFGVALGPHVAASLGEGYDVLVGEEIAALAAGFGVELRRYFAPAP
ncbi:MAG: CCA tRNA nucleotidyltransferase [Haloarculaceae archaeon]